MYLEKDRLNAARELECYAYFQEKAKTLLEQGKFDEAIVELNNMIYSAEELKTLRYQKATYDQALFLLKQIESSKQHHDFLQKMGLSQ